MIEMHYENPSIMLAYYLELTEKCKEGQQEMNLCV